MSSMLKGIDVSHHQGDIDWGKVSGNIDFAIIRAGYGKNNIDKKATQNVQGCVKHAIPFGLYWFSYAYTVEMARNEARYLIQFAKEYTPLFPLYYDFEYDSIEFAKKQGVVVTNELLREMATAFCDELEKAGYYAGIYANYDYIKRMYGEDIFKRYDLWYARWGVSEPDRSVYLWQSSCTGSVPGISGNVDTDVAFIDYEKVIKDNRLNGYVENTFVCPNNCPHCPHCKGAK